MVWIKKENINIVTTPKKPIAVCLISGGLDSAVASALALHKGYLPIFLFLDYGQKTLLKEENCFDQLVKYWKIQEVCKIRLPWVKTISNSALLDKNVTLNEKNFLSEYVPFRNSIFLSIATALAEAKSANFIVVGSTGGDHICPDNSPKYINHFQKIIKLGTLSKNNIKIFHPLSKINKIEAVKIGNKIKVPFKFTWSCHNNLDFACGHCSNCLARIEAFKSNQLHDPISYAK